MVHCTCIGYTMRMRGYRIYTTEGEARGRVYSMTPNPNCITGLYQNAEAFPFPIGSPEVSNVINPPKWRSREHRHTRALNLFAWARVRLEIKMSEIGMFMSEMCKGDTFS